MGEDVAAAVEQVEQVKKASEEQRRQDAETAKQAAHQAKMDKKDGNPETLAEAAVQARKELASEKQQLQNLIAAEMKGRTAEDAVRRALARLRVQKALTRVDGVVK